MDQVEAIKAALPDAPAFVYEADHGFNCDHRATYDALCCRGRAGTQSGLFCRTYRLVLRPVIKGFVVFKKCSEYMRISRFTIHDVPLIMPLLSFLFKIGGRLAGWQIFGDVPRDKTIVLIAAPHTSNWDFLIFLYGIFVKRLRINVLAKHTLFWWPLGPVLKFFGCVPVRRTQANNLVDQGIEFLQKQSALYC